MKTFYFCTCVFLLAYIGYSQPQWVEYSNDQPSKPEVTVLTSTNESFRYRVEIPGIYKDSVIVNGENYQRISIPGGQKWGEPGYPEVPSIGKLIAIPECRGINISVELTDSVVLNGYKICPAPFIIEDTSGGSPYLKEEFLINDSVYGLNQTFPSIVFESKDGGYLRAQKVLQLSVYPMKYNPSLQQLVIYTRFDVTIHFQDPESGINLNHGYFTRLTKSTLLNYSSDQVPDLPVPPNPLPSPQPGTVTWKTLADTAEAHTIVADYLIITDDQFFNPQHSYSLELLANHRAHFNGFDVVVVSVQNILDLNFEYNPLSDPDWFSEQKIRTFIKRVYEGQHAAHTYDGKVAFICLVGDAGLEDDDSRMPTSFDPDPTHAFGLPGVYYAANDYYFSCVTKDNSNHWDVLGDIFIGRLCADNESDLAHIVSKIRHNEKEYSFGTWKTVNTLAYGGEFTGWDPVVSHTYFCTYLKNWLDSIYNPVYTTTLIDKWVSLENWNQDYIDHINTTGSNIVFHFGHGLSDVWCFQGYNCYQTGAITMDYKMANLANYGKYPFVISHSCLTGHFTNNECMAEKLTSYSYNAGYVGYFGSYNTTSMDCTLPGEFPNTLPERIMSAIYSDLSSIIGEAVLEARMGVSVQTSSSYNPTHFQYNLFADPAYNLMAPGYEITHNTTLPPPPPRPQTTTISTKVFVRPGVTLSLSSNAIVELANQGQLIVENGATLEIGNNVTIKGQNANNKIIIEGVMCGPGGNIGNPVPINNLHLIPLNGSTWRGVEFNNPDLLVTLNGCSLSGCYLTGKLNRLEAVASTSFTNSMISLNQSSLLVDGCSFMNSNILSTNYNDVGILAQVLNSTFLNSAANTIIRFEHSPGYAIQNCTITYDHGTGIDLYYCGNSNDQHIIKNNIIQKSGISQDMSWGIRVYHTFADIEKNLVTNNRYGVSTMNQSQVRLIGNANASSDLETQRIINNYQNQVRAYDNSFPFYFHYNVIQNTPSGSTYLVYYSSLPAFIGSLPDFFPVFNVKCNCFDNSNPSSQLYPSGNYYWSVWCPPSAECQLMAAGKEQFEAAVASMDSADYSTAETQFKSLIADYPGTIYAWESAKKLIPLIKLSNQDFDNLKLYFDTASGLHADSLSDHLAYRLGNMCNVEEKSFSEAIAWFESDISTPASIDDSVYSLIDLSDTYMLMQADSGLKSSIAGSAGTLAQYRPRNIQEYVTRTNEWIRILFQDQPFDENGTNSQFNPGYLLNQNNPNPFTTSTQLTYYLPESGDISIVITNIFGQQVQKIDLHDQVAGNHTITIDFSDYSGGIYIITLVAGNKEGSMIKVIKTN